MDVICEQCGAEYEFDETLLSDKGTTVKCSACGHVFRVMPQNRDIGRAQLKLRPANGGRELSLASLRDLQQRIGAGEVSLDDQIGREGHPFRPLREIPELKNFFNRAAGKSTAEPGEGVSDGPPTVKHPAGPLAQDDGAAFDAKLTPTVPAPPGVLPDEATALPRPPATPHFGDAPAKRDVPAKRTMMGVGPASAGPRPKSATADGGGTLGPTAAMLGGARGEAPRTPASDQPKPHPHEPFPRSGAASVTPTLLGSPGTMGSDAPRGPDSVQRPAAAGSPSSAERSLGSPPPARMPAVGLPGFQAPPSSSAPAHSARPAPLGSLAPPPSQSVGPLSPGRSARPPVAVGPAAPRVQLYLSDDEAPPASTISRASSKLWLVALILVLLGAAGWYGVQTLIGPGQGVEPQTAQVAPDPSATGTAPPPPATPTTPPTEPAAAPEPTAPEPAEPAPAQPAAAAAPKGESAPAPEPAAPEKARRDKAKEKSEPEAKPERAAESEDYGQLVSRAAQLSSRGDHAGATKLYRAALGLRPTGSEANSGLGFALLASGKTSEALPLFDRAVSSGFVDANIGLGDAYRKLGQPSSAVEAYRAYLERMPSGSRAAHARQWIEKLEKGDTPAPSGGSDTYRPAGELEAPPPSPPPAAPPPSAPSEPAPPADNALPERAIAPSESTP